MNKRILLSSISLFSSLALVTGATFAFFSDVGTSTDNVFAAGNLNLQLDDVNETTAVESVTASFAGTNLAPGQTTDLGFVSLHNGGTLNIAEIELAADRTDANVNTLPSVLNMTIKTGSNQTCINNPVDRTADVAAGVGNGVGPVTLQELIDTSGFDALPGITPTETYFVCMAATMDSAAGNEFEGASATIDFLFTANQDASQ